MQCDDIRLPKGVKPESEPGRMSDKPKQKYDIAAIMNENINVMRDVVPWANETRFRVTKVEKGHVFGVQP